MATFRNEDNTRPENWDLFDGSLQCCQEVGHGRLRWGIESKSGHIRARLGDTKGYKALLKRRTGKDIFDDLGSGEATLFTRLLYQIVLPVVWYKTESRYFHWISPITHRCTSCYRRQAKVS